MRCGPFFSERTEDVRRLHIRIMPGISFRPNRTRREGAAPVQSASEPQPCETPFSYTYGFPASLNAVDYELRRSISRSRTEG